MKRSRTTTRLALIATIVTIALAVSAGVALVPPSPVQAAMASQPVLQAAEPSAKLTVEATPLSATPALKTATPIAQPTVARAYSNTRTSSTAASSTKSTSGTKPAGSELSQARSILAGLIAKHPILKGTTVSFGDARGYQAIALYTSGRIIISPSHTASLSRILNHEVWHIIDWRDNGKIDWGENVPPR